MPAPEELRDRSAHRVPDGDDRTGVELDECRRAVVGAVREAEDAARTHTARVTAKVGRDDPEMFGERFEHLEPVQPATRDPAVQQQQRRRARRTRQLAHERRAPAGELDPAARREDRFRHERRYAMQSTR